MIPFKLTPPQFASKYRSILEREAPETIDRLRALFSVPVPAEVTSAEVQLFLDEDGEDSPGAWIYFDGKDKRIDPGDQSIFPGQSIQIIHNLAGLAAFDPMYFRDDNFGGIDIAANVLKSWFAECWWKANGWGYPVSVSLVVHDDYGDGEHLKLTEST